MKYTKMTFEVTANLIQYVWETIRRLEYLYPEAVLSFAEDKIIVTGLAEEKKTELTRDIRYGLYRAKINAESKPLRDVLFHEMFKR